MSNHQNKPSRNEMQAEALVIKSLLSAAMAVSVTPDPNDEAISLIEMAHRRASSLNTALDAVNA